MEKMGEKTMSAHSVADVYIPGTQGPTTPSHLPFRP